MSRARWTAAAVAALLLPLTGPRGEDFRETAQANIERHTGWKKDGSVDPKEASQFRKALKKKLDDRAARGKRAPKKITYETPTLTAEEDGVGWGPGDCEEKKRCETRGYVVRYRALTSLEYDGPDEVHDGKDGGKPEWPRLVVARKAWNPDTKQWDTLESTDYTQAYKDKVAKQAADMVPPQKAWKDDPNDPADAGQYEFGQEPRLEDVIEEITFTFKKQDQAAGAAFFQQLSAALAAGTLDAERAILMGFTYQGPNIDYTIGSRKRVCLFGCFYLWDIRAGFALDFGLGLRVPAYAALSGPSLMVAGATYAFSSRIDTAGAYGDWSPPQFTAAGVNPYSDRGQPPGVGNGEGNEFVMFFELFAGAKVEILEINVCPYCQYVEVNVDYSTSFATPFGFGTRFPIPQLDIPVKDFNYGIVSLGVGLYVRPDLFSTNIGAVTSAGTEVAHSAPGSPSTFEVVACIAGEAPKPHLQTVSLDEFRYHFDRFQIVLGATLDLSVAGYGVWSPSFDFLTLDLSRALGSLGIYLPDHENCDFTFSCTQAPAVQQVAVTAELLDQSPPSTKLVPSGAPGKNGWWISDVTGTLTATDNPVGCGAGVAATTWSLDGSAPQATNPFQLTAEKKTVVSYASSDRDGNTEAPRSLDVWIDKAPPVPTGAPLGDPPNARAWYKRDVTIHFAATDATSGVASITPDTLLSAEAANQSATGTAEDFAGLTASVTVGGINIDKTAPAVAVQAPSASGTYRNTDVITLAWTAQDAVSGVFTQGGTLDGADVMNGQVVELIYLGGGNHDVRAFATDSADNLGDASVTFLVDVDIDGLLASIDKVCGLDWVTKTGTCNSLRAKVLEAKLSLAAGLATDARGQLGAFLNELDAQQDKSLLDRGYRLLRTNALYVLRRYGLVPAT